MGAVRDLGRHASAERGKYLDDADEVDAVGEELGRLDGGGKRAGDEAIEARLQSSEQLTNAWIAR